MSRIKAAVALCLATATVLAGGAAIGTEDTDLRDLDITGWDCANPIFHDWHLEIFENPSNHAPQEGDPTPIICEITPRTEQRIYRDGIRIQSLAEFLRLQDVSYQTTTHKAKKVRVTGYLLWDDDHNGSADVGSTVQYFSKNGFHHPWRSTAWEIHPIIKIEALE